VIRKEGDGKLDVRRLTVLKTNLGEWDLCSISLPDHPSFDDASKIKKVDGSYVALTFSDMEEQERFNDILKSVIRVRKTQEANLKRGLISAGSMERRLR
jgi:hypothetical protein